MMTSTCLTAAPTAAVSGETPEMDFNVIRHSAASGARRDKTRTRCPSLQNARTTAGPSAPDAPVTKTRTVHTCAASAIDVQES